MVMCKACKKEQEIEKCKTNILQPVPVQMNKVIKKQNCSLLMKHAIHALYVADTTIQTQFLMGVNYYNNIK